MVVRKRAAEKSESEERRKKKERERAEFCAAAVSLLLAPTRLGKLWIANGCERAFMCLFGFFGIIFFLVWAATGPAHETRRGFARLLPCVCFRLSFSSL
jgi:hypothetical protein